MKIKMLSTQQYAATGTTYEQGHEYDLHAEQAKGLIASGDAVAVDAPDASVTPRDADNPRPSAPPPPRVHPDTSKPLSTLDSRNISDEEAIRSGYPQKRGDDIPVFAQKSVVFRVPRRPTGVGPGHIGGVQIATARPQTVLVKHHESVIDILKFLRQPTDGSVLIMKPSTQVPFGLEDYPYAELQQGDVIEVVNYVRPAHQPDSTAVLAASGNVALNDVGGVPMRTIRNFDANGGVRVGSREDVDYPSPDGENTAYPDGRTAGSYPTTKATDNPVHTDRSSL